MHSRWLLVAAVFLITTGCGEEGGPAGTKLAADAGRSFLTPVRQTLIGIHGPGWALRIRLAEGDFPYYDGELPLERRVWAEDAMMIRGAGISAYVRPPSGTPTMPLPVDGSYALHRVEDLWLRLVATERPDEPDAYVDVTLEPFTADGIRYVAGGALRVPVKGPYP